MNDVAPRTGRLWLLRLMAAVIGCVVLIGGVVEPVHIHSVVGEVVGELDQIVRLL